MDYIFIYPPELPSFFDRTRAEAEMYYLWYLAQIPERIAVLQRAVNSSKSAIYQTWQADKSPESLQVLSTWLSENVGRQKPTDSYKARMEARLKGLATIEWIPSDLTMSLIIDIGIYFGEVFTSNFNKINWGLYVEEAASSEGEPQVVDVDYQQPVLFGFTNTKNTGEIHMNPENLVHVVAIGYLKRVETPHALYEAYLFWSRLAT